MPSIHVPPLGRLENVPMYVDFSKNDCVVKENW